MKTNVQPTSLLAYLDISDELGDRQKEVLACFRRIQPASNTMISNFLCLPINSIVPRIFELRKKKLVVESHRDTCQFTKRKVIFWKCN